MAVGLDVSHDAFSAAYSAFNRFRQAIAKAAGGGSVPPHEDKSKFPSDDHWYWGDGYGRASHPGLHEFFMHSDCDGEISPDMCAKLADEMEALLPKLDPTFGGGHIERDGGIVAVTERFIAGCRAAAKAGEPLEFH